MRTRPATYWFDDEERLQRLYAYCKQDVEVEREIHGRVPLLSPAEHALWVLSGQINEPRIPCRPSVC